MRPTLTGYRAIVAGLWFLFGLLFLVGGMLVSLATGTRRKGRPVDCLDIPDARHRPDPYIYSQFWLYLRGIGFTWDNPDFAIIDPADGMAKDPHMLAPSKAYRVEATIRNHSTMAAAGTTVDFKVLRFGAGTQTVDALPSAVIDVPALGSAVANAMWTTPPGGGHHCLQAWISHPDDANSLNNVGQHNVDVAVPASPERRLRFHVGNPSGETRRFRLEMNGYRLPAAPLEPPAGGGRSDEGRRSLTYLRRLQAANRFEDFPVPAELEARLEQAELVLPPGAEVETFVEMLPAPPGGGRKAVNVNIFLDAMLIGGVTAYVEEA